ncbi:acetyl-CoA carboxylase, carboxyltransferase subunit beta [Kamptonema cortianum]|nr:acetyl-CoA carboxylase, carboxyltransferase subunit beta [Kamptonema cortianum]MDL5044527.1 acetyl-CoA carboxylase, carboxyltransferase subunit beta [Oscillatoria amoena NRMC-F 0135]
MTTDDPKLTNFEKPTYSSGQTKKRDIPEGLWEKCPACGEITYSKELDKNQQVCPKCGHHNAIGARERIEGLVDEDSFVETDADMVSKDTLKFTGVAAYKDKLSEYQKKTGLKDAVISGHAKIHGQKFQIAVMDFSFLAASMGSVVGEKIARVIEAGTKAKCPVVIISASGGARMYEGMLSLMQMAKTSAALARHAKAGLPYVSVLTNPTTAGVMASYASLGDLIIAEPKAMIGFAGPRVIKETTHQDLPKGFQTAEFLLERGLIDMIVPRLQMRATLNRVFSYLGFGEIAE